MKKLKYLGVIAAIIAMFVIKNKMDNKNKEKTQAIDNLDDGITVPVATKDLE